MPRKVISITGTRSDYGLMSPVFREIAGEPELELALVVTGMHLMPEFAASLARIREDPPGRLCFVDMNLGENDGSAMARSLGLAVQGISSVLAAETPDVVLLQGDRGEMLAGAIAAAHMNIPLVHMSGGDFSGSIDDSIRNAISKFSHLHLTTCEASGKRLLAMGEAANRIHEVGEPGLDLIRMLQPVAPGALARELDLDLARPIVVAAQHPVTTEADSAGWQIAQTLDALEELGLQTVFTYPNSDAGGREMVRRLEERRGRPFLRIVADLGSTKYLSLLRIAAVLVGNSSSGIFEAPSFELPAVNIGTRQHGRLRARNVIDVDCERAAIVQGMRRALSPAFRASLTGCGNPYGDGYAAPRTVDILKRLRLVPALLTKWVAADENFLVIESPHGP